MDWNRLLASSLSSWLDFLTTMLTDPRAAFWWPTVLFALAGAVLVPGAAARNARPVGLVGEPFLRELPIDVVAFLGYTYTQALMAPLLAAISVAGTGLVLFLGISPVDVQLEGAAASLAVAALAFVASDFCLYWSHRLFHAVRPLWALHALHHRPTVLTPVTAFRFWPPEAACHFIAFSLGEGVAFGVAALFLGTHVTPMQYAGVNVFLLAWYLGFSHLRHSHFALAFPLWLSRILVSPHMHQAHHSVDSGQRNRNFGTALAIWDWAFGTLYIPAKGETFRFGVEQRDKIAAAHVVTG